MIVFPNAKINFGLNIIEKRKDNFHNIETVFYPFDLYDILEVVESKKLKQGECSFNCSGIEVDCELEDNIIIKAYRLLAEKYDIPGIEIYFHKNIPYGAGLGGGSADAAFMLKLLNEEFQLGINNTELEEYASMLGSDCPFFIKNTPVFAHGRGELFEEIKFSLAGKYMVLVKLDIAVSTAIAYSGIKPQYPNFNLRELEKLDIIEWKEKVVNDFEINVFKEFPQISIIKNKLYEYGAVYASMSGSGASVFALFEKEINLNKYFADCFYWSGFLK